MESIEIILNNTEISDSDHAFQHVLSALRYLLISVSKNCKNVSKFSVVFLRAHRNEKNEEYAEEIKIFLEAISVNESLNESMKEIIFDSSANEIMVGLVSSFYKLQVLKIVDCNYLEGEYFPLFKTEQLRVLNLKGSHQISYEHILNLVKSNSATLRSLKIDGENVSGDEFSDLVDSIDVLEEFHVYYCNEAYPSLLKSLMSNSKVSLFLVSHNCLERDASKAETQEK